jgi:hypothetical protein
MAELDILITILGTLIPTLISIISLAYWLGKRFETIDKRFELINEKFKDVENKIEVSHLALKNALLAINSMLIEFMGLKGLITLTESKFLMSEVSRIISIIASKLNPISKDDLEFLKEVISKEDPEKISMEDAEKIIEIGKRWWIENGSEEAYKVFLTGLFIKAYHLSKKVKSESIK